MTEEPRSAPDATNSPSDGPRIDPDGISSAMASDGRSTGSEGDELSASDRLLRAAGPVLARRGFDKATVREIAGIAGVNVAAVSYHFGDKMGLYRAVVAEMRRKREHQFPVPVIDPEDAPGTLLAVVRTILSRMMTGRESGWEAQLMMREMHQPTQVLREMIQKYFRPLFETLCDTIQLLLPPVRAEDPSWVTEALVPQLAFGVVGQCHHHMIGQPVIEQLIDESARARHYDLESMSRHITACTLAACRDGAVLKERHRLESQTDCDWTPDLDCHLPSPTR
ncbi:MAG: CerR family C-terminal domain-containing protein [Planctomycetota bacterium]